MRILLTGSSGWLGTDFAAVLDALAAGRDLPFAHDPSYVSPRFDREALRP
ncbi:MAG TPA: hypothetical protein VGF77_13475 [Allosphingosinicella sp.]|jgi:hypothetical protein